MSAHRPIAPFAPIAAVAGPGLSRRSFLVGAAGLVVLGACGGGDGGGAEGSATSQTSDRGSGSSDLAIGVYFDRNRVASGEEVRLAFGLLAADGSPVDDMPRSVDVTLRRQEGGTERTLTVERHGDGVPRPYYPVRTTFDEPGMYDAVFALDGGQPSAALMVVPPGEATALGRGATLPTVATPTVADPRGVDPICTAEPACPLHETSLDAALQAGRPIALLVSTPAFCQTAVCGPVLDLFLEQRAAFADRVTMIHAEVYKDPYNDLSGHAHGGQLDGDILADVVGALGLTYEPALYLADASGTVVERLDFVFDRTEIAEAFSAVA